MIQCNLYFEQTVPEQQQIYAITSYARFEQLCFTNTSNIQQSSNHPGPQSSCLVIHKAIVSILKRLFILYTAYFLHFYCLAINVH